MVVGPAGNKHWCLRYTRGGKAHEMGLGRVKVEGSLKGRTLAEARASAAAAHQLLAAGVDPIAERDANGLRSSDVPTFRSFAENFIVTHEPGWRAARTASAWRASLATFAYPVIGDLRVNEITIDHVLRIIQPLWGNKTETASRLRARIAAILDAAKARGLTGGDNPAAWRGGIKHLLPATAKVSQARHFAALPYAELPAFVQELRRPRRAVGPRVGIYDLMRC